MTQTRVRILSTTALASLLCAAPAFAQAPAPAPMYAPAPAPMYAPAPAPMMAPAPEAAVMPVAPVVAPRSPDDMTGSVGFGVGVVAGTNDLIAPNTANLMMKYWMSDSMAIVPRLALSMHAASGGGDTTWGFSPSVLASFVLLKGASTRLSAGVGLGIDLAKEQAPAAPGTAIAPNTDTYIGIYVPVQIGVEHFFTRWFAMGISADFRFLDFSKQGDPWKLGVDIDNTTYMGSLFFYTD